MRERPERRKGKGRFKEGGAGNVEESPGKRERGQRRGKSSKY